MVQFKSRRSKMLEEDSHARKRVVVNNYLSRSSATQNKRVGQERSKTWTELYPSACTQELRQDILARIQPGGGEPDPPPNQPRKITKLTLPTKTHRILPAPMQTQPKTSPSSTRIKYLQKRRSVAETEEEQTIKRARVREPEIPALKMLSGRAQDVCKKHLKSKLVSKVSNEADRDELLQQHAHNIEDWRVLAHCVGLCRIRNSKDLKSPAWIQCFTKDSRWMNYENR